jgi:hypothetical protein
MASLKLKHETPYRQNWKKVSPCLKLGNIPQTLLPSPPIVLNTLGDASSARHPLHRVKIVLNALWTVLHSCVSVRPSSFKEKKQDDLKAQAKQQFETHAAWAYNQQCSICKTVFLTSVFWGGLLQHYIHCTILSIETMNMSKEILSLSRMKDWNCNLKFRELNTVGTNKVVLATLFSNL